MPRIRTLSWIENHLRQLGLTEMQVERHVAPLRVKPKVKGKTKREMKTTRRESDHRVVHLTRIGRSARTVIDGRT